MPCEPEVCLQQALTAAPGASLSWRRHVFGSEQAPAGNFFPRARLGQARIEIEFEADRYCLVTHILYKAHAMSIPNEALQKVS